MQMRQKLLFRSSPAICPHSVCGFVPVCLKHHINPVKHKMLHTSCLLILQSRGKRFGFLVNCLNGTIENSNNEHQTCYRNDEAISYDLYNESICELCTEGDVDKAMGLLSEMEALGFIQVLYLIAA
uniref:Putative ovule protein n=1 Tax=Solanum chacoense TaxID=4108 RepID=A0A0V0H7M8_SOLCH